MSKMVIGDEKMLQQNVMDELDWEPSVDSTHIGVLVEKGVVTLTGYVSSYAEKRKAEEAARRVKGVRAIAEEIEVRLPGDKRHEDDQIAERALKILDWDATLPKGAIQVKVEAGVVTLTGTVDWLYQRSAADAHVQRLGGVIAVRNDIQIRPRLQPNAIKEQIVRALNRNAAVDAAGIVVSTAGSKVILSGKVQGWHDRDVARAAAWCAPGVTQVEDNLKVA